MRSRYSSITTSGGLRLFAAAALLLACSERKVSPKDEAPSRSASPNPADPAAKERERPSGADQLALRTADPPTVAVAQGVSPAADASATSSSSSSGRSSDRLPAQQILEALLVPQLAEWSHEEALARLSELRLTRVSPIPGQLLLARENESGRVALNYMPDAASIYRFADATAELAQARPAEALALYRELASICRKRLGKPAWEKDEAAYPSSGFKLGVLDVSLGAVAQQGERPYVAFSIAKRAK